jgi:hypothetical protein
MFALVDEPHALDLMVVIGGYNSSNTTHLQEIAISRGIRSFHIDAPERIGPGNRIEHKPLGGDLEVCAVPARTGPDPGGDHLRGFHSRSGGGSGDSAADRAQRVLKLSGLSGPQAAPSRPASGSKVDGTAWDLHSA